MDMELTKVTFKTGFSSILKVNLGHVEISSKMTRKTPERRQWRRSGVFNVNFEHVLHLSSVSIIDFGQRTVSWIYCSFWTGILPKGALAIIRLLLFTKRRLHSSDTTVVPTWKVIVSFSVYLSGSTGIFDNLFKVSNGKPEQCVKSVQS